MNNVGMPSPRNLEECVAEIKKWQTPKTIKLITKMNETKFLAAAHHSLGRTIRNVFKLWEPNSVLSIYFKDLGLHHADDMSGVILTSFHRYLNNKHFYVEEQVEYYKNYWKKKGVNEEVFNAK